MQVLLKAVEQHIIETGTPPTRFGRDAVGDPKLVDDLRRGREPKHRTSARILAFIAASGTPGVTESCAALLSALRAKAKTGFAADARSVAWHCGTRKGERHRLTLRFRGWHRARRIDRLVQDLDRHEFALPGLLVADIVVCRHTKSLNESSVSLEALTLEV